MKIQVVDNGEGISKENMQVLGRRYFTSKCKSWSQLEKHVKYYGFHGEALASISECAKTISIISKHKNSSETYGKILSKTVSDEIKLIKNRPSIGTTITVEGFFFNLPVRRKRIVADLELEDIKSNIESLLIIYPNISFTIRNDITSELILKSDKSNDIISAFKKLHPDIDGDFNLVKIAKEKVKVEALLYKKMFSGKNLQYIYFNKRPIDCSKIQKLVHLILKNHSKSKKLQIEYNNKYPVFLFNIKCPYSRVDILMNPNKTLVEFKDWEIIKRCIEKLVFTHLGKEPKVIASPVKQASQLQCKSGGVSQIIGAFKANGYKRKNREIIEETQIQNTVIPIAQNSHKDTQLFKDNNKSEHYTISDSTHINKRVRKGLKKPLPIEMSTKHVKEVNNKMEIYNDGLSDLSKFTNDENKGKHFIMDMFLKSTQAYKSDEYITDTKSEETIYEEESNFLLENNFHTNINGKTKTMSVSVNVKSTRKIWKRKKNKVGKSTKAIQTTLENGNKDKCLQTTMIKIPGRNVSVNDKSGYTLHNVENYTVEFANSVNNANPILQFVYTDRKSFHKNIFTENFNNKPHQNCFCNCHSNDNKLFNVPNVNKTDAHNLNNIVQFTPQSSAYNINKWHPVVEKNVIVNKIGKFVPTENKNTKRNSCWDTMSPYFLSKRIDPYFYGKKKEIKTQTYGNMDWIGTYKNFDPMAVSTQSINNHFDRRKFHQQNNEFFAENTNLKPINQSSFSFQNHSLNAEVSKNDNLESKFFDSKPRNLFFGGTEKSLRYSELDKQNDFDKKRISNKIDSIIHDKLNLFSDIDKCHQLYRKHETTLMPKQMQQTIETNNYKSQLLFSLNTLENQVFDGKRNSLITCQDSKARNWEDEHEKIESQWYRNDWIKKYNNIGSKFYVNKNTGTY